MESIQLAQMLADLSDLSAAQEAEAALALVSANKTLAPRHDPTKPSDQDQLHQQRPGSAAAMIAWTTSPAKFDKFGRRIPTPPMTRTNSSPGVTSGTSTPREAQSDDDVARATSLMQLYEIRAQLRQQDTTGLNKARERINAIQARQQQQLAHTPERREPLDAQQPRFTYPKAS